MNHGGQFPRVRKKAKLRLALREMLPAMIEQQMRHAEQMSDLLERVRYPAGFDGRPASPPPVRPVPNPEADALSRNAVLRNDAPDDAQDQAEAVDADQSPRAGVNQPRDAASDAHQEADADGRESTTPPVDADRRSPPASSPSPMSTPLIDEDDWPPRETRWGPR